MKLKAPAGRGGGGSAHVGPGPLPRYGELGGHPYLLTEAGCRDVVGVGHVKLRLAADDVLSGD
eukprot:36453-Chlamydomonas_euryale.AAC.1